MRRKKRSCASVYRVQNSRESACVPSYTSASFALGNLQTDLLTKILEASLMNINYEQARCDNDWVCRRLRKLPNRNRSPSSHILSLDLMAVYGGNKAEHGRWEQVVDDSDCEFDSDDGFNETSAAGEYVFSRSSVGFFPSRSAALLNQLRSVSNQWRELTEGDMWKALCSHIPTPTLNLKL